MIFSNLIKKKVFEYFSYDLLVEDKKRIIAILKQMIGNYKLYSTEIENAIVNSIRM